VLDEVEGQHAVVGWQIAGQRLRDIGLDQLPVGTI